jgi:hypothetical protein
MLHEAIAICAGVSLSAACGFRVFLPPLVLAAAVRLGVVPASAGQAWLGATPTLIVLGVATACELLVYKVPWLDHAMDTVATPGAVAAGVAVCAAILPEDAVPPAAKWAIAIILGGGAAGAVQGGTVVARATSGATTGGLGNPLVAKIENVCATVLSVLAIAVPIVAAVIVVGVLAWVARMITRRQRTARAENANVEG